MGSNSKAVKSGIWYTISNFLLRSVGIITTPIFTRLLTKQDFGLYSNFTSWLSVLSLCVTLNLGTTFISARFDFKDKFDEYILSMLGLCTCSIFTATLFFNVFSDFFVNLFGIDRIYINCMMVYLVFSQAIDMLQVKERFLFGYKKTVFISCLTTVSTALLSVLLVVALSDKLAGRIFGSVVPTIIIGLVVYVVIVLKGKRIRIKYWKYALPICLPYIPHVLSLNVLNSADRIMITNIRGPEENALYSLAYLCGSVITILVTSLNSAFSPWLGEKLHEGKFDETRSASKYYITLFLALAVGLMLISPEIILVFGGKSYMEAKYVMPPVMSGCVIQFLYTMFVNVEQFKKRTLGMALASASSAGFNLVLNYIFIPKFGYIAAAYTTLASFLWLLIVHMFLVKRIHYNMAYDYKFVSLIVLLVLVLTVVINALYIYTLIRYILIACYAAVMLTAAIKNRGKIKSILRGS